VLYAWSRFAAGRRRVQRAGEGGLLTVRLFAGFEGKSEGDGHSHAGEWLVELRTDSKKGGTTGTGPFGGSVTPNKNSYDHSDFLSVFITCSRFLGRGLPFVG
jgi:hypothetical protein